jgi:RimJ/RimL family protein N-acetyltransferase
MTVPVLETARLLLREPVLADFHAQAAMWLDPRMGDLQTEEESWLSFQCHIGNWRLLGWGYWVLVDKGSNAFVGTVGFQHGRRQIDYAGRDAPEMGWAVAPDWQRRGLAREAVTAALAWADTQALGDETWCFLRRDNVRSRTLAEGAGFRETCHTDYKENPVTIFCRRRGGA